MSPSIGSRINVFNLYSMQQKRFKYTILRNHDGKFWLWFDEKGTIIDGKYRPNLQPYHEIDTRAPLREGAEIWTEDLESIPASFQLRPFGEYTSNYVVKAKILNEERYLAVSAAPAGPDAPGPSAPPVPAGKKPGRGPQ